MEQPRAHERRQHPRRPLPAALSVDHAPSRRAFPARSVDISQGGLLMLVPATAPVQAGHAIRLRFGRASADAVPGGARTGEPPADPIGRPDPADTILPSGLVAAEIVRVDRARLLASGQVAVGARFV